MVNRSLQVNLMFVIIALLISACGPVLKSTEQIPTIAQTQAIPATATPTIIPTATPTPVPFPKSSSAISPENAVQVKQIAEIGFGSVLKIDWSVDGSQFLVITTRGVYTYDAVTYQLINSFVSPEPVGAGAFSPDKKQAALEIREPYKVIVVDLTSNDYFSFDIAFEYWDPTIVFLPEGKLLVTGSVEDEYQFLIYDVQDGQNIIEKKIANIQDWSYWMDARIAVSADGGLLAYSFSNKQIILVDIKEEQTISTWELDDQPYIIRLAFSPDGKILAAGLNTNPVGSLQDTNKEIVRLFDVNNGDKLSSINYDAFTLVPSIKFSPDGKLLAIGIEQGFNKFINLWDLSAGENLTTIRVSTQAIDLVFKPTQNMLTYASEDGTIQFWDMDKQEEAYTFDVHRSYLQNLTISQDGKYIANGIEGVNLIQIRDAQNGMIIANLDNDSSFTFYGPSFNFLPDGKTILSINMDGIHLWDLASGKEIQSYKDIAMEGPLPDKPLSPDGKLLYIAEKIDEENVITVWDTTTNKIVNTFQVGKDIAINNLAVSPDGTLLAVAMAQIGDSVMILNAADGSLIHKLGGFDMAAVKVLFSPDGNKLVTHSYSGKIILWNTSNWKKIAEYDGRSSGPYSYMAFTPDGSVLAVSGNVVGQFVLLDGSNLKELAEISGHYSPLASYMGRSFNLKGLAFSSDGTMLFSTSNDGTIKVWGVK
jgi:WD40 repeat protein